MRKFTRFLVILVLLALVPLLQQPIDKTTAQDPLAPDGASGEIYYAPYSVSITLDGDLSDWEGVPRVQLPRDILVDEGQTSLIFAAASDGEFLYLLGDVTDTTIISGEHGTDYWNEDSIEFYLNGTNDFSLTSYTEGVVQITIPALNISSDDVVIAGVQGTSVGAEIAAVETEGGYAVEVAVPLNNDVWTLAPPQHGLTMGFQVHLNGASTADRDTKLIWSVFDTSDQSYQNPSVFGKLVFFDVEEDEIPEEIVIEGVVDEDIGDGGEEVVETTPAPVAVLANAPYKNPNLPIDVRVENLMSYMTVEEKIGQMTLVERGSIANADIAEMGIGALLSGGGGYPPGNNTPEGWAEMVDTYQTLALESRLEIPLLYGVDAVHGHSNLRGAVIFPHNIGLGATHNPELVAEICRVTAQEMIATGIYWNYGPVVAVPQDIRWGRSYEGYGQETELVSELATACLSGLQGESLSDRFTVLGTVKHFVGDGGVFWGTSETYPIDQGVTDVDEVTLRAIHLPPYQAAIDSGAMNIMISFSSWGGMKMHAQQYLITDVLRGEMGFEGFIVSDWAGIDQITNDYYEAVVTAINAGVDMNMVPYDYRRFINVMLEAIDNGDVPMERVDDAVRRILTAKFELGLFEWPYSDQLLLESVGSDEHREVARQAVRESMVLLKNDDAALPIAHDTPTIFVAGGPADNIGIQSGGWTIEWQGGVGDITEGTTILDAIEATVSDSTAIYYNANGQFDDVTDDSGEAIRADVGIVVVGETPYAEGVGDDDELTLSSGHLSAIENMREYADKVVVIIISGRPLIITDEIENWDAVVAAWLTGTEGQGVADVLFGDYPFTGTLSFMWPRSMDQVPYDPTIEDPLFPIGYGLED
jgi:beta-glucosidase